MYPHWLAEHINVCQWDTATYFIISDNVFGNFIYYSHFFPAATAVLIGLFVFASNPKGLPNRLLLLLATVFAVWSYLDLILWATERIEVIMFVWSILIYFNLFLYIIGFYFFYAFLFNKLPSWRYDLFILITLVPLFLFAHTSLNLSAFDLTDCWREALEGPLWQYYVYNIELVYLVIIITLGIKQYKRLNSRERKDEVLIVMGGLLSFLLFFTVGNIIGSYTDNWEIGQYGLFGMPIFAGVIAFTMLRYKSFHNKVLTTDILVTGIIVLLLSTFMVRTIENTRIILVVTLVLISAAGLILTRAVRKEVEQKSEIEVLMGGLARANKHLQAMDKQKSEFVSIASHQLRSPLTAIRGYASMLLEGSYGKFPNQARKPLEVIAESSRLMALSIEDYLNVSRIESGNMKYDYEDFNLVDNVTSVVDGLRVEATRLGLLLMQRTDTHCRGIVHADRGKVEQILHNLINNALKYTKRGSVTIYVRDDLSKKMIYVDIIDTGVGMTPDTIASLFQKFHRAENANQIDVYGTGLGLFVAKKMANAMGGDITAHSLGEGLGSTFTFSLPIKM